MQMTYDQRCEFNRLTHAIREAGEEIGLVKARLNELNDRSYKAQENLSKFIEGLNNPEPKG